MLSRLYVIHDICANDIFGAIIRVNNDEVARRAFHDALQTPDSPFKGHEADYNLLYIGSINSEGSIFVDETSNSIIARGADWIAANNQKPELLK